MTMDKRWFMIEAYSGQEHDLYLRLAGAQLECWRPIDIQRPSCRRSSARRPLEIRLKRISRFGSYIFLNAIMTESLFHAIRNTKEVKRVVCYTGTNSPCVIDEKLIKFYKESKPEKNTDKIDYKIGDKVMIENGPLQNTMAIIKSISKSNVLELELNAHNNHSTRVIIECAHVRLC